MKITVAPKPFRQALATLRPVAPTRTPNPRLTHVVIDADGGGNVHLAATNGETTMVIRVDQCEVIEQGKAEVPFERLGFVMGGEDGPTEYRALHTDADCLSVAAGGEIIRLFAQKAPGELINLQPIASPRLRVRVHAEEMRRMLSQVIGLPTGDVKNCPGAIGILFEVEARGDRPPRVQFTATNGHVFGAVYGFGVSRPDVITGDALVYRMPLQRIEALLESAAPDDEVLIVADGARVTIDVLVKGRDFATRCSLSSVLVEGAFPPVRAVMERRFGSEVKRSLTIVCKQLQTAIDRAAVCHDSWLLMDVDAPRLQVLIHSADERGQAVSRCAIQSADGSWPTEWLQAFGTKYLLRALQAAGRDETVIIACAPSAAGPIRFAGARCEVLIQPRNLAPEETAQALRGRHPVEVIERWTT